MDVRIGIVQTVKEGEVELADDADRDAVLAEADPPADFFRASMRRRASSR